VDPHSVVKHFNPFKDASAGFGACMKLAAVNQFVFKSAPEGFHRRVIIAVGLAAHARCQAPSFEPIPVPEHHNDEYSKTKRLTYFEIVGMLYYITNRPEYGDQKSQILGAAEKIIKEFDPENYAESAYLLLDLASCPFLSKEEKDKFIQAAMQHSDPNPTQQEINEFRNFVGKQVWYFNWNQSNTPTLSLGYLHTSPDNLRIHLKKKELLLAY